MTKLRLAIVGAGPAGIYAADILLKAERQFDVSIDLFEQLPAPYGLVRYGVAPDHPRIKGVITALREVLDRGDIRIFGNVEFGRDITLDDLKKRVRRKVILPLQKPGLFQRVSGAAGGGHSRKPADRQTRAAQEGAAIRVSDIHAIKTQLEANGLDIGDTRVDERDGKRLNVFFVVAPDGLCFYFNEPVDG